MAVKKVKLADLPKSDLRVIMVGGSPIRLSLVVKFRLIVSWLARDRFAEEPKRESDIDPTALRFCPDVVPAFKYRQVPRFCQVIRVLVHNLGVRINAPKQLLPDMKLR